MVDEIAQLLFLPAYPRGPIAVFDEIDGCDMADNPVGVRLEKGERLFPVSADVLRTVFEAEWHAGAAPFT